MINTGRGVIVTEMRSGNPARPVPPYLTSLRNGNGHWNTSKEPKDTWEYSL